MILKASQRGGAKQLALHLLRTDENEHVELHELRGFVSDDLVGALKEAEAVSRGTRCRQHLYSVSLNPPEDQNVDIAAFEDAVRRIEAKTGLEDHPRAIVFHEKEGRRHAHAVWSRIDAETMTAKNLAHDKLKMRDVSRALYLEHGWRMPRGLMNSRAADPRNFTLAEWRQAKRMGLHGRDLKEVVRECWAVSDSRAAFSQALEARGMRLARGDRRGHVIVTHEGEVLSVARYAGRKAKAVQERLGEADDLPSVEAAKRAFARDLQATFKRHIAEAREQKRRALEPLEARRREMASTHRVERQRLDTAQRTRWLSETRARSRRLHTGLRGVWQWATGERVRLLRENEQEARSCARRDGAERQALIEAQLRGRRQLQEQIKQARTAHRDLLLEIRADRKAVAPRRTKAAQTRELPDPPAHAAPKPAAEISASHSERLKNLRWGRAKAAPSRTSPEIER